MIFKLALGAVLISSGVAVAAGAQTTPGQLPFRLCVLDKAALVERTHVAQNLGAQFQQIRRQTQTRLDKDRVELEAQIQALGADRASGDPKIARQIEELRAREEQINLSLSALDSQLTENVVELSEPFVRSVEMQHGCSMLIERSSLLHLSDISLDITPAVIERMNTGG